MPYLEPPTAGALQEESERHEEDQVEEYIPRGLGAFGRQQDPVGGEGTEFEGG